VKQYVLYPSEGQYIRWKITFSPDALLLTRNGGSMDRKALFILTPPLGGRR